MRVSIRTRCRLCVVSTACPTTARGKHRSARRWGKTYRAADGCKSLRNPGKLPGWFSDVPCSNPKMAQLQAAKLISQGNLWRLASQGIFAAQQSLLDRPIAQLDFPALTVRSTISPPGKRSGPTIEVSTLTICPLVILRNNRACISSGRQVVCGR